MRFLVNKTQAILSAVIILFFGSYGLFYLLNKMWPEALFFLFIFVLFDVVFFKSASIIKVDPENITLSFLGKAYRHISWSDVKEIGLIMEHRYHHKKRGGEKYIYFSPHKMTASERYKMILNWPPKKMLSMEYSEKRLEYVMTIWGKELKAYNVEELFPNSED